MNSAATRTFPWRDALLVGGFALGLRLLFQALAHDTFDYDEFVNLVFAQAMAHGTVPYRDFLLFQPPGALVLLRLVTPLTDWWWPSSRIIMALADTVSALLVWRLGVSLFGRRAGLLAGLLYGLSPLALVSGDRVGQDPLITLLGLAGLTLLVTRKERGAAALAGVCLAVAIWVKYPALYFLPMYFLAALRRSPVMIIAALVSGLVLFLPFQAEWHALYQQTIVFQRTRWLMATNQRVETIVLYWLVASPLALAGLMLWRRLPLWLPVGFLLGGLFGLTSQVYYHYFVIVVPFGALLSAPILARLSPLNVDPAGAAPSVRPPPAGGLGRLFTASGRRSGAPQYRMDAVSPAPQGDPAFGPAPTGVPTLPAVLILIGVAVTFVWGELISNGGPSPLYVTAAHLSNIQPAVSYLQRHTGPGDMVLGDQLEYAYLAQRPAYLRYFWNVGVLIDAGQLERENKHVRSAVMSYGASSGYPPGFTGYLDRNGRRFDTSAAAVWILSRSATHLK